MKSGSGTQTSTSTQSTQLPAWLENFAQQTATMANDATTRPYQGYTGERVQGFTPDQIAAQEAIRARQGQTGAALGALGQTAQGLAGYRPDSVQAGTLPGTNLDQYMNPYLAQVEQTGLNAIDRSRRMTDNQIADRSLAGGAYGGSRFALQQAENAKNAMEQSGQFSGNIRAQGFMNAQQQAQADLNRQMQAGMFNSQQGLAGQQAALGALGMAGNLFQGQQGADYRDIGALAGSGQQQQGLGQAGLDVAYQNWQQQQQHDLAMAQARTQIAAGLPHGSTMTGTQTTPVAKSNPLMQIAGLGMSGLGMAAGLGWQPFAAGAMGSLGQQAMQAAAPNWNAMMATINPINAALLGR